MIDVKSSAPAGDRKTLVEEGTTFKGSLSSSCPIVVRGRVEGELAAPSLTVTASGTVHGKVKVDELRSQGEIAGEIDADLVQLSGVVRDNTVVRAKSIDVKLAPANGKLQLVFGDCILDVGDLPGDAAAMKPGLLAAVPDATPPDEPKVKKGKAVPTPAASEPATVRGSAPPPPREP